MQAITLPGLSKESSVSPSGVATANLLKIHNLEMQVKEVQKRIEEARLARVSASSFRPPALLLSPVYSSNTLQQREAASSPSVTLLKSLREQLEQEQDHARLLQDKMQQLSTDTGPAANSDQDDLIRVCLLSLSLPLPPAWPLCLRLASTLPWVAYRFPFPICLVPAPPSTYPPSFNTKSEPFSARPKQRKSLWLTLPCTITPTCWSPWDSLSRA
jgi:hypothetical protein